MYRDFKDNYNVFIRKSTLLSIYSTGKGIFYGWAEDVFVIILDEETGLRFYFGNVREKQKIYFMPYHSNTVGYRCFWLNSLEHFPKDFVRTLKNRGLVFSGKYKAGQETTLQRLIAACRFDLKGFHVHHYNSDITDNEIENLVPVNPDYHTVYHANENPVTEMNFLYRCFDRYKTRQTRYSRHMDEEILYTLCFLRFIHGYKIKDFRRLKFCTQSVRTLHNIFRKYIDFQNYYEWRREEIARNSTDNCRF